MVVTTEPIFSLPSLPPVIIELPGSKALLLHHATVLRITTRQRNDCCLKQENSRYG